MKTLGILVRTDRDPAAEAWAPFGEEILTASREHGHIFVDLSGSMATRANLARILTGIGSPSGPFLKLVVFYCHGNDNSPIDQDRCDFITEDTIRLFAGWGVYCIGCNVGRTLGHKLLEAGGDWVIAFNSNVGFLMSHIEEVFTCLNAGMVKLLRDGIDPSAATEHMRVAFLEAVDRLDEQEDTAVLRKMMLHSHAESLEYHGPSLTSDLENINPGRAQASEYQQLVAKVLHEVFAPTLDEPRLEVSNESGSSRYDIVFMNRAERGFWHDIKVARGNAVVIFDAKNKKELVPSDADQLLRYSGPWRGKVVFIACREPPTDSFSTRCADLLKEKEVCLLTISDTNLKEMHSLKRQGADPTIVVERLFRQRVESA